MAMANDGVLKKKPAGLFLAGLAFLVFFLSCALTASAKYNDYSVNKPSAFRDFNQVMIWDSEILDALQGLQGRLMFSTGSCFSGGFVDDLTQLDNAAVVTANDWHGFGLSLYDFLPGQTSTWAFHDEYMDAFRRTAQGPPSFEAAYLAARDTVNDTDGNLWYWGGVEHPQFAATGGAAAGTLAYQPGDRAILYSGMWPGNEYFLTSFDNTIAGGREMLMDDYGWPADAVITLFYDGNPPPERPIPWNITGEGTKENLLNAMKSAATDLGPGNTLAVFVIAHGRSSAAMTSRLLEDRRTIEYLLIPNGRSVTALGDQYPATVYGITQVEITGLQDLQESSYEISLPDSLADWHWRIDARKRSLFLEADDPANRDSWLMPGTEYIIRLKYGRMLSASELGRAGWILWLPETGGGPLFQCDNGTPEGGGWGMGEHVPGGPALGSPDPSSWGNGWTTGGDGWVLIPWPAASTGGDSGGSDCFIRTAQ